MKKVGLTIAALILIGAVLVSCSNGTATMNEPVKISIFVGFGTGGDPAQVEVHKKLAQEFNSSHKAVQIEFITVPNPDHVTKFSTMLASDTLPDIVMPIGVMGVAEFYDEWLDLAPYLKKDNYDSSDFYGPALEAHTYADRTIGLPFGVYPSVVFYNADLFDKANLPYPPKKFGTPDWTYDKLVAISQKLTLDKAGKLSTDPAFNPDKIAQYGFGGWEGTGFRAVPGKFGGNMRGYTDATYKTAQMNHAGWKAALQFLADNTSKYHISPQFASTATGTFTSGDPLGTGKVAMWECFSWASYLYTNWTNNFHWNVAAIPAGPTGQIIAQANSDAFAITKHSKHPDQAWEVAKWLLEPARMSVLAKSYGCIPARKTLASTWLEDMKTDYPKVDWDVFIESINYQDKPNHESWSPNYRLVWDEMNKAMDLVCSGSKTNGAEVADELNSKVQQYTDEYWKTVTKQ